MARYPRLPTSFDDHSPKGYLEDDFAAVCKEITELTQDGYSIIVPAHSWGGFVASEAISPDLYSPRPGTSNGIGGVVYPISFSAWMLEPGTLVMDQFAKSSAPNRMRVIHVVEFFCNNFDAPEERQRGSPFRMLREEDVTACDPSSSRL